MLLNTLNDSLHELKPVFVVQLFLDIEFWISFFEPIHFHEKLRSQEFNIFYNNYLNRINFFDTKFHYKIL